MFACKDCRDTGWVCEAHPIKPWAGPRFCGCGAGGMPCPKCSEDGEWNADPDWPPNVSRVLRSLLHMSGKKVN